MRCTVYSFDKPGRPHLIKNHENIFLFETIAHFFSFGLDFVPYNITETRKVWLTKEMEISLANT